MATALTVYANNTATTTLTTADGLVTTAPAASASVATTVARSTGYIELRSITATTGLTAGTPTATTPAPSGNGWLFDVTTLEGQQILAGTWTPALRVSSSTTNTQAAFYYRVFKYNAGTYTNIGFFTSAAAQVNSAANTATAKTFTGNTGIAATTFATGDKLYIDVIAQVTVSSGSGSGTISIYKNSGAADSLVTPGYQPVGSSTTPRRRIGKYVF